MKRPDEEPFPAGTIEKPVLVVAHPDDEALWFTSLLRCAHRIIVCFRDHAAQPQLGPARSRSLAEHPLRDRIVDLGLEESGSFALAGWPEPAETREGLMLEDAEAAAAYAHRAAAIAAALPPLIEDATAVFTHNPWGEYGHEDHVQVCRVVTEVAGERGIPVWYSLYAGTKSLPLLRRYLHRGDQSYVLRRADPEMGQTIADVYRRHGAWTWFDDYRWFRHDIYVRGPLATSHGAATGWLGPVNLLEPREPRRQAPNPPPGLATRWRRRIGRLLARRGSDS